MLLLFFPDNPPATPCSNVTRVLGTVKERSVPIILAVAISTTITCVVSFPVGVVVGCCGTWCKMRRGKGGRGDMRELGAIYEEPALRTVIPLSENQAYGQVSTRNKH